MRKQWYRIACMAALTVLLASCGSEQSSSSGQMNYKDMKTMVIDILKTDEAKKVIESSQQSSGQGSGGGSSSTMSALSMKDQQEVRLAVKDVLVSPDYNKVIKELMTDTKFAGEFAKAVNKENKDLHKELIKDPDYQASLLKAFQDPQMEKMLLETLQGSQYRKEVMTVMQEAMQTPLFRLEIYELLKSAVKEELEPKAKSQEKQKSGGQSGGEGGGQDQNKKGKDEKQQDSGSQSSEGSSQDKGSDEEKSKKEEEKKKNKPYEEE